MVLKTRALNILRSTVIVGLFFSYGCKKIVEIEDPTPKSIQYCEADDRLLGRWYTDSVWITTTLDTLDSTIINKSPTMFFLLEAQCSSDVKYFSFKSLNYGGAFSEMINSSNYIASDSGYCVLNAFDASADVRKAEFKLNVNEILDSTMTGYFSETPSQHQQTNYTLFLRRY